jgi:hypothetical protein
LADIAGLPASASICASAATRASRASRSDQALQDEPSTASLAIDFGFRGSDHPITFFLAGNLGLINDLQGPLFRLSNDV